MPDQEAIARKLITLFPSLDEEARAYLLEQMPQLALRRGEVLFYQNDVADALYIIVQGKLGAFLQEQPDEELLIGTIGSGETVGENGLITQQPRALTVKALTDCVLLELSSKEFTALCQKYPLSMMSITQLIVKRHQEAMAKFVAKRNFPRKVAFICAAQTPLTNDFFHRLKEKVAPTDHLSIVHSEDIRYSGTFKEELLDWIEETKFTGQLSLFCTDISHPALRFFYEGFFDAVIWVVDAQLQANVLGPRWQTLTQTLLPYPLRKEILLLHDGNPAAVPHTQAWLQWDNFAHTHHVRVQAAADYDRVLRFLTGKAVGLVLSGGGARGWAHIGALRAIIEKGIPIDAIGGTSAGAVAAACYATTQGYDAFQQKFYDICMSEANPFLLKNFTIPHISLLSAKQGTKSFMAHFGELRIEDLLLPLFCVACDLNQSAEAVWQQGVLWKKLRGSMALPGFIPPMVEDGHMYVDGGVINNLPVDVMRQVVYPEGIIIAVDIADRMQDAQHYDFPPILGFVEGLKALLRMKRYTFPSFRETMLKALMMGALDKAQENRRKADFLIRPDVGPMGLMALGKGHSLIEAGYAGAEKVLVDWNPALLHL